MSERKLHPAAFLVTVYENLGQMLFGLVVAVLITGAGVDGGVVYGVIGLVVSAGYGWARWTSTAYWVEDGALHHRSGVLTADETTIPVARIAAIDEVEGPVQRLFGVVAVHVQVAGGGAAGEIVLAAVTRDAADELRGHAGHGEPAQPARADPAWRIGRGGVVLAALTGPQFAAVGPVVAGVFALLQAGESDLVLESLPRTVGGWTLLVAVLAAAALLLSLIGAVVAFAGFSVYREVDRLVIRRGLLSRRSASVSIARVHGLHIVEGALPRKLGLCSVRLEVAGYRDEASTAQMLLPICRRSELGPILDALVSNLQPPDGAPQRPPVRARSSFVVRPVAALALVMALAALVAHELDGPAAVWWGVVAGALAGAGLGAARYAAAGWWVAGEIVAARSFRFFGRTTTVARAPRLQQTGLRQTAVQRRSGLATAWFALASGRRARVPHLEMLAADQLVARLAAAARG